MCVRVCVCVCVLSLPLRAPLLSVSSCFFLDELRVTVRTEPLPLAPTAGLPALVPGMVSKSSVHARVCCVCVCVCVCVRARVRVCA